MIISLLVLLVLVALVWWAGKSLIVAFGLPSQAMVILNVVVVVLLVLWVLRTLGWTERLP
jgi:hypothetical protein